MMNQQPYQPQNQQPQQPYQNQYQQYPGGPQTGGPQTGGPQTGGPGYPPPKKPGWLIPLIVVAVVGVALSALLGGILIGGNLVARPETIVVSASEAVADSWQAAPQESAAPTDEPAPTEEPLPAQAPAPTPKPAPAFSVGECLDEAIDWIEDGPTYVENYTFEPLGCVDDFDGDGNQDFLAAYETQAANGTWCVSYVLFTFLEDGPKLLDDGILYQEVGGNGGSVGIAEGKDGAVYLTRFVKQPEGDRMNNQYAYIPWDSVGTADEANSYYMEARWTAGEEEAGTYILGDSKVDRDRFEKSRGNYTVLYELNIVAGHGNGLVNGADFDSLENWYDD